MSNFRPNGRFIPLILGSAGVAAFLLAGYAPMAEASTTPVKPANAAAAFKAYASPTLTWSTSKPAATHAGKLTAGHGTGHAPTHAAKTTVKHAAKPASSSHSSGAHRAAKSGKTHLIYDSISPSAIPQRYEAAVYANGHYQAHGSQVSGHRSVLWIDVNGSDRSAQVLDVEPGDATPSQAAQWVKHKLQHDPSSVAIIYTMRSAWVEAKADVGRLPGWMHSHVRWWIADPTGSAHLVNGSQATQWYWGQNFDISTATAGLEK